MDSTNDIREVSALSVQSESKAALSTPTLLMYMARSSSGIAPWWSAQRDRDLRRFYKKPDHLAGTVYTIAAKMTAIPRRVVARNTSVREHVAQAAEITDRLESLAQFGAGWETFYSKFVEDLFTQDNGAFAEIIGNGDPAGPIVGAPITIASLDSARCIRTGDRTFPVIYQDVDGKMYKLHFSRVMYASQMPSPIVEMLGVGFCAVSRCVNVAQNLLDILLYKQEKLGSRPHRAILVSKGGLDPEDVKQAFAMVSKDMDNMGLSKYSKMALVGSATIPEAGIDMIDLASLPEGFNEQDSITLGMATISLAFGIDARELFPAIGAGASRADALLQHLKQRGKAPGQTLQITETLFNTKFLPPHLKLEFDFQDDAEDRQVAEIKQIRSNRRTNDLKTGALNTRVARQQMVHDGDLTQDQFEELELADGRLSDGTSVLSLFLSKQKDYTKYLNVGVSNPLLPSIADIPGALEKIELNRQLAMKDLLVEGNYVRRQTIRQALAALDGLEAKYNSLIMKLQTLEQEPATPEDNSANNSGNKAGQGAEDPIIGEHRRRVRTTELTAPNDNTEAQTGEPLKQGYDERINPN